VKVADQIVQALLDSGTENPASFMASFSNAWHAEPFLEPDGWLKVQWYRGMEKVGEKEEVATGDDKLWVAWMEKYLNWLDTKLPFDSNGGYGDVNNWCDAARQSGFLKQYRRTPAGRVLPPPPV